MNKKNLNPIDLRVRVDMNNSGHHPWEKPSTPPKPDYRWGDALYLATTEEGEELVQILLDNNFHPVWFSYAGLSQSAVMVVDPPMTHAPSISMLDWVKRTMQETDDPIACDKCGVPVSGEDGVTDDVIVLCGSFYGNGCADEPDAFGYSASVV